MTIKAQWNPGDPLPPGGWATRTKPKATPVPDEIKYAVAGWVSPGPDPRWDAVEAVLRDEGIILTGMLTGKILAALDNIDVEARRRIEEARLAHEAEYGMK